MKLWFSVLLVFFVCVNGLKSTWWCVCVSAHHKRIFRKDSLFPSAFKLSLLVVGINRLFVDTRTMK